MQWPGHHIFMNCEYPRTLHPPLSSISDASPATPWSKFTVLLDPGDPLLQSERTQGFADPDYWKGEVFAYVGLPQNLKDLKSGCMHGGVENLVGLHRLCISNNEGLYLYTLKETPRAPPPTFLSTGVPHL